MSTEPQGSAYGNSETYGSSETSGNSYDTTYGTDHDPSSSTPASAEPTSAPSSRDLGPAWSTITWGLIVLSAAGGVIAYQLAQITTGWTIDGTTFLIALGVVIVIIAGLTIIRGAMSGRRSREDGA